MALTSEEKVRVRHHLGYPVLGMQPLLQLGVPAGGQPHHLLEMSLDRILPEAEPLVRTALERCDCVEKQMDAARDRLKVESVEGVRLRGPEELGALETEYSRAVDKLCDLLATVPNPFSRQHQKLAGMTTVVFDS